MIKAEIITIGTEIVMGQIVDTNTPYIARTLTEKGISVLFQTSVGDDKESVKSVLRAAKDRADIIVTTGGLGPTANDITRDAVSEFLGVNLLPDKAAGSRIQKYLVTHHIQMKDEEMKQTLIPEGARIITNSNGTATGFAFRYDGTELVCLPGVPGEMQSMLKNYFERYGTDYTSEEGCALTRRVHAFGISERDVEDRIKNYQDSEGQIKMMTLVHEGIITVHICATAAEREGAIKRLDNAEQETRKALGQAVFGIEDETLEYAVATLLKKRNKTIAVAESCTGGLVADKLTNISGISEYFLQGVVAYSNVAKVDVLGVPEELILKHGAVSPQVARAMAGGIKKNAAADVGVGITGIAGPAGATKEKPVGLVYIGVIADDAAGVKECRFRGSRIDIKNYSAHAALNMVRLILLT